MENLIVTAIVAVILVCAVLCIRRAKKKGAKCVGCPHSSQCGAGCSCGSQDK